jgi:hypothetical protein
VTDQLEIDHQDLQVTENLLAIEHRDLQVIEVEKEINSLF